MHVKEFTGKDATQRELEQCQKRFNRAKACMSALLRNWESVAEIKSALPEDTVYAKQLWDELELKDKEALILAPKFGGCFTTLERTVITGFWREAGV